jgi:hypothetical protein
VARYVVTRLLSIAPLLFGVSVPAIGRGGPQHLVLPALALGDALRDALDPRTRTGRR